MKKFIFGNFRDPIEPTEKAMRKHFKENRSISLYGFDSIEEVRSLIEKFPKYTKVKESVCGGTESFEIYGIGSHESSDGWKHKTYGIYFSISQINDVTGEFNETGKKRINKFIEILVKEGYLK